MLLPIELFNCYWGIAEMKVKMKNIINEELRKDFYL